MACSWIEPSMASLKPADLYAEASQIRFTKAQRKREAAGCGDLPPAKIPPPTPDECTALYSMLHATEGRENKQVKSCILSVVPGHAERLTLNNNDCLVSQKITNMPCHL